VSLGGSFSSPQKREFFLAPQTFYIVYLISFIRSTYEMRTIAKYFVFITLVFSLFLLPVVSAQTGSLAVCGTLISDWLGRGRR